MNEKTSVNARRLGFALVLALATSAIIAAPYAAAAFEFGLSAGGSVRLPFGWVAPEHAGVGSVTERPPYVITIAPADRAEELIRRHVEQSRELAPNHRGLTADRLDRMYPLT